MSTTSQLDAEHSPFLSDRYGTGAGVLDEEGQPVAGSKYMVHPISIRPPLNYPILEAMQNPF